MNEAGISDAAARHADNLAYCRAEVETGDNDRFLASRFAPQPVRDRLIALYAFALEIHRIPASISEPPLAAIRQQWWREALDEVFNSGKDGGGKVRAHPVVEALAVCLKGQDGEGLRPLMEEAIDAIGWFADGESFADAQGALARLEATHGAPVLAAVRLCGADPDAAEATLIRRLGALAAAAERLGPAGAGDRSRTNTAGAGGGDIATVAERLHALAHKTGTDALADSLATEYRALKDGTAALPAEAMPAIAHAALVPAHLKAARILHAKGQVTMPAFANLGRRLRLTRAVLTGRV